MLGSRRSTMRLRVALRAPAQIRTKRVNRARGLRAGSGTGAVADAAQPHLQGMRALTLLSSCFLLLNYERAWYAVGQPRKLAFMVTMQLVFQIRM